MNGFDLRLKRAVLIQKLNNADQEKLGKAMEKMGTEVEKFPTTPITKKEFNENVAKENGISVDVLITSPNFAKLCAEYNDRVMAELSKKIVAIVKKAFEGEGIELDDTEAGLVLTLGE